MENGYQEPVFLPLVSIIITHYSYGQYLRHAVESARHQTYERVEVIVVDDASPDEMSREALNWAAVLSDVRVIVLGRNVGQMGAIKTGVENANGDFVVLLDADDMLRPEFVERHVLAHLNGCYSAGISASDTIQISETGAILEGTYCTVDKHRSDQADGLVRPVLSAGMNSINGGAIVFNHPPERPVYYVDRSMAGWHGVAMSCFMFRRELLVLILPSDCEPFRICADYYLVLFCHSITGTLTLWEQLSYFRFHSKNGYSNNPVLGGPWMTGQFEPSLKENIEHQIAVHIAENFDRMQRVLGSTSIAMMTRYCSPNRTNEFVEQYRFVRPFFNIPEPELKTPLPPEPVRADELSQTAVQTFAREVLYEGKRQGIFYKIGKMVVGRRSSGNTNSPPIEIANGVLLNQDAVQAIAKEVWYEKTRWGLPYKLAGLLKR